MIGTVAKWEKRILLADRVGLPGQRVFPGYRHLADDRPPWWTDDLLPDAVGLPLGAHELVRDVPDDAFIVTDRGLAAREGRHWRWQPYDEIVSFDPPPKVLALGTRPELVLRLSAGARLVLVFRRNGEQHAFVQFLSGAMRVVAAAESAG